MTIHAPAAPDRPPPPEVPPVVHKGVRYEQDLAGNEPPGSAPGGTLAAYDQASGQRLWLMQVYTVQADPRGPSSHPGRYFRSMALVPGRDELAIEDEDGGQHRVDLMQRSARRVGGPPETAPPASTKPKPKP